ncbi:MAG: hypothetical protein HRT88_00025 [Lentisphaeraceae bacterium]|nr:hypothetical protein [Lentisphaeraceae bacterium]
MARKSNLEAVKEANGAFRPQVALELRTLRSPDLNCGGTLRPENWG